MTKRIFAFFIAMIMTISCLPTVFAENSSISITDFKLESQLETVKEVVLYGGDTENVTYKNTPQSDNKYLIIEVSVVVPIGVTVDLDSFEFNFSKSTYTRIINDDFLTNHNYNAMRHGDTALSSSGFIVFEVPSSFTQTMILSGGKLTLENNATADFNINTTEASKFIEQHDTDSYVLRQEQLEEVYLATAKSGDFTPDEPYIIVNPYEVAPLSAVIIFETEQPTTITTSIIGKTDEATITNTIDELKTYHEIPLIGLYEGENTVTVKVSGEDLPSQTYTYEIETVTNSKLPQTTLVEQDLTQISEGLYMLKNPFRTLIDVNGDIRGYFDIYTGASVLDEIDENGHFWVSADAYSLFSTIYEYDYTGYIYREIFLDSINTHHDAYLLDDELLIVGGAINLDDYSFDVYNRAWEQIFNSTQGSFEVRDNASYDWLHFNTIADGGDGYILVSMRNQHAVAKLSYPEMEVVWVLSDNEQACLNDQDKYLTPIGEDFEWFYSQHDVSLVSQNDDGTIDVTVFDNGIQRGLDTEAYYEADDMYSRMVTYRIDEQALTVEQIWEYGKELGTDGLSFVHGSTQYIEESDTYLGNFDTLSNIDTGGVVVPREKVQIIEVNQEGEIVFAVDLDETCYRVEKVTIDMLYSSWQGLGQSTGEYSYITNAVEKTYDLNYSEQAGISQILEISANKDFLYINGIVTGEIDEVVSQRLLLLENSQTGQQFYYSLENDSSMVQSSQIVSVPRTSLNSSAGFYQNHLNLQSLDDGTYTVSLIATQNDVSYLSKTGYTLKIGQDVVAVETDGVVEQHNSKSEQLLAIFEAGNYTLSNPMTVLNPYDTAPLSAIVAFETEEFGSISVEIDGKDDYTTVTHEFSEVEKSHILPIYGLYSDTNNKVTITFTAVDGTQTKKTIYIKTQELPEIMPVADVTVANTELMADGFTYGIMEGGGSYAFDANGDVRWYTTIEISTMPIKRLANGNIISGSDTKVEQESTAASLFEFDMLGRVHNEYMIYGAHHEVLEMANGDLIVSASIGDTVEDYIVRLDRSTGEIVQDWDMKEILSDMEHISDENWQLHVYNNQTLNNPTATETAKWNTVAKRSANDWFHNNALYYDESDNTIMASGRTKDAVVKFDADTGEVIWILADPNTDWAEAYADKLLTPIGEDFEYFYGNHAITVADDDILLFDNGNYRSKDMETVLEPNDSYSRGVRYTVDEENMTVEQVWQYGKELGSLAFSSYISDIDYLDTDHYLINFGGILTDVATGDVFNNSGALNQESVEDPQGITLIVEIKDDEIINELHISASDGTANTYRVERMTPYFTDEGYVDLTLVAKRLGSLEATETAKNIAVDEYTNDLNYTINSIFDSGEDVYFDITVKNYDSYYIVLDNGINKYVYSSKSVVKYGLDNGQYLVGIATVDGEGDVYYQNIYRSLTVNNIEYSDYYQDVNRDNWFYFEVMAATYAGLFRGTDVGIFSPYESMTVSMVETVLNRMSDGEFAVTDEILEIISADINDEISREQLAFIMYKYGEFIGLDMAQNTNILSYADAFSVSDYAFESLQWACEKGIILGTDENELQPQVIANRSQVAAMMMRLMALDF